MTNKRSGIDITQVVQWEDGKAARATDYLSAEEPLEMRTGEYSLGLTLRTPGDDEELVAGFLFSEGIIRQRDDLLDVKVAESGDKEQNLTRVTLAPTVQLAPENAARRFSAGSACGVCGKASIDQLRRQGIPHPTAAAPFDPELLCKLPAKLREAQAVFGRTGGLHAAGLFTAGGELLVLREDIGRHNAVDKVIGWAFLRDQVPLSGTILMVSGRGGFEIAQKAVAAGIPLLASVSAPSSLAVQLARELGLTLVGFLRGRRFVIYSCEERLALSTISTSTS